MGIRATVGVTGAAAFTIACGLAGTWVGLPLVVVAALFTSRWK
jgi:hypothetical protein